MDSPAQRLFEEDVQSVPFRSGVFKRLWGMDDPESLPVQPSWPIRAFWLSAAARPNCPTRFYLQLDLTGYRSAAPTGTFWDPATKAILELSKRPKGRPDSRVARVFRTDWNAGTAFYHPYDRVAATGHPRLAYTRPTPGLEQQSHDRGLSDRVSFAPQQRGLHWHLTQPNLC